jgi:hypothetical protein
MRCVRSGRWTDRGMHAGRHSGVTIGNLMSGANCGVARILGDQSPFFIIFFAPLVPLSWPTKPGAADPLPSLRHWAANDFSSMRIFYVYANVIIVFKRLLTDRAYEWLFASVKFHSFFEVRLRWKGIAALSPEWSLTCLFKSLIVLL